MDFILSLDQQLFLHINHLPHNALFDGIALVLSVVGTAGIIWFVLGIIFRFFVPLLAAGGLSWLLVEVVVKPIVARMRPTVEMGAIIIGSSTDGFSFPSGHAAIAFAMAVLLSQKEPRWRWVFWALAGAISFSRIYLGVHYPLDVIVGAILGWALGRLITP